MSEAPLDALPLDEGAGLACPSVGVYRHPPATGALLGPGEACGQLVILGRARTLRVPAGVAGQVTAAHPGPRGWGEALLELAPLGEEVVAAQQTGAQGARGELLFRAPMAGRFYRRPAPDADPYALDGAELQAGSALGMLEVMKTFSPLRYEAVGGLPARARVLSFLVEDGAEVEEGQPLLEVEAAEA